MDPCDARKIFGYLVVGYDLAIGVQFAESTADELCCLRAKVEDEYLLLHSY